LYSLMSLLASCVGLVPEKLLGSMAQISGVVLFDILRVRRGLILRNIRTAFPSLSRADAIKMGRSSTTHLVTTFLELLWVWRKSLDSRYTITNPEVIDEAMKRGQGVYILCTHTGNFEVMAAALGRRFAKVTSPVKRVGSSSGVNRFISENRARQGIDALVRSKKGEGFLAIRRALEENRLVGFMMDQARPGEPRVELFGRPAKTNTSLGAIWERCPAPLVPVYAERVSFARHIVHILPEVTFPPGEDPQTDILNRARACNTIVEDIVKRCPEQYWWIHDRWK
jgi:Kdo2-lipid IVA lauroyltransferase/acyltransferase